MRQKRLPFSHLELRVLKRQNVLSLEIFTYLHYQHTSLRGHAMCN